jgi:hypothetical protein
VGRAASRAAGTERIVGRVSAPFAPRLTSLADDATFAWVPPAELLDGLENRDLESVDVGSVTSMRSQVTTLVRSRAWRETAPVEADYLLAFVQRRGDGHRWTRSVPLNMHRTFEPQAFLEPMLKLFLLSEP